MVVQITSAGASLGAVQPVSGAYELTAVDRVTGQTVDHFLVAPQLTIHYSPIGSAEPSIYFVDSTGPQRIDTVVNATLHTVTAALPHFSLYVTGATLPGGSPYYSFDVIAKTGDNLSWLDASGTLVTRSILSFGTGPSINSSGAVAFQVRFTGTGNGNQTIFLADADGTMTNLGVNLMSSTRTFGNGVQVNDGGEVIATDSLTTGNKVRIFNATVIGLSGNDPDGNPITYTIASGPSNGTLGVIQGNIVLYTPNDGFTGTDSFTYKAKDATAESVTGTVTLLVVDPTHTPFTGNHAPVATTTRVGTLQNQAVSVSLQASDPDGNNLIYSIVSAPTNGTLGAVAGNKVTYTPNAGYFGADSFTFSASDGSLSSTATAVIPIWATGAANNQPSVSDLSATFQTGSWISLANGGTTAAGAAPGRSAPEFDSVIAFPTINNAGDVAFIGLIGNTNYIVTPLPQVPTPVPLPMNQADASSTTNIRPMIDDQGRVLVRIGVPAWEARRAYRIGDKVTPTTFNIAGAPYVFEAVQIGISPQPRRQRQRDLLQQDRADGAELGIRRARDDACHDRRRYVPVGDDQPEQRSVLLRHPLEEHRRLGAVRSNPEARPRPDPSLRRGSRARRHEAHEHAVALRRDRRREHGLRADRAGGGTGTRRSDAPRRSATTARRSHSSAISPIRRCALSARRT